jgi:hypothetical protein
MAIQLAGAFYAIIILSIFWYLMLLLLFADAVSVHMSHTLQTQTLMQLSVADNAACAIDADADTDDS